MPTFSGKKSVYDGIWGDIQITAAQANLQHPYQQQIYHFSCYFIKENIPASRKHWLIIIKDIIKIIN